MKLAGPGDAGVCSADPGGRPADAKCPRGALRNVEARKRFPGSPIAKADRIPIDKDGQCQQASPLGTPLGRVKLPSNCPLTGHREDIELRSKINAQFSFKEAANCPLLEVERKRADCAKSSDASEIEEPKNWSAEGGKELGVRRRPSRLALKPVPGSRGAPFPKYDDSSSNNSNNATLPTSPPSVPTNDNHAISPAGNSNGNNHKTCTSPPSHEPTPASRLSHQISPRTLPNLKTERELQNMSMPPQRDDSSFTVGGTIFSGMYTITGRLGCGTYGEVYKALYVSNGVSVAIKVAKKEIGILQIKSESKAYAHCRARCPDIRLPKLHWAGPCNGSHVMIMEVLGDDIDCLLQRCNGRFSGRTVAAVAAEMLELLHTLHMRVGCIHRDVKPANFALKDRSLYLLDLGFARTWSHPNGKHIEFSQSPSRFMGTPRFASFRSHFGEQSSRRDDLESLGYSLLYMLTGTLPWISLNSSVEVAACKQRLSADPSALSNQNWFLSEYFARTFALGFEEEPDYAALAATFTSWAQCEAAKDGHRPFAYDWENPRGDVSMGQKPVLPPLGIEPEISERAPLLAPCAVGHFVSASKSPPPPWAAPTVPCRPPAAKAEGRAQRRHHPQPAFGPKKRPLHVAPFPSDIAPGQQAFGAPVSPVSC